MMLRQVIFLLIVMIQSSMLFAQDIQGKNELDGINTPTSQTEKTLPLTLMSNMVDERLVLRYHGDVTSIKTTIVNLMGQVYTSAQFPMDKDAPVQLDVSDLQDGLWVLRAQDVKSTTMASYLFVKF